MSRVFIVLQLFAMAFCSQAQQTEKWISLFNGRDLRGWETYLSIPLDSNGNKLGDRPTGFNADPQNIYTVDSKQKAIRISGQTWGSMFTTSEYSNYHLQLKFRWGKYTWAEKRNKPMDSGLLYHSTGVSGTENSAWMRSQEFQVEENNCGDYWIIGDVRETIPCIKDSAGRYSYDPDGDRKDFGVEGNNWCHRGEGVELPRGEWNTLDLYCFGDTSVHMVNGKTVMVLYASRHMVNGKEVPLTKGKIQLQSEGAEVFYKDIRIANIDGLHGVDK